MGALNINMNRILRILRTASGLAAVCLLAGVISSQAASLTVNTTADAGIGSLRQAIIDANIKNLEQLLRQKEILSDKTKARVNKLDEQILELSTNANPTTNEANRASKLLLRKQEIIEVMRTAIR